LPKGNEEEKAARTAAIQEATKYAIEVPFRTMKKSFEAFGLIKAMVETGNPNSVSDAGVGALCALTAVKGAWLNVKINASGLKDQDYLQNILTEAAGILQQSVREEQEIFVRVVEKIG
jgi:glutamate formiminotransferase/formiminotetrahydrofolate cyclodeaminase